MKRLTRRAAAAAQVGDERLAPVVQAAQRAAAVRAADGVLAEERKRDRRIAVGDDRVGQHAGIHLAPAHGLGRRRAREPAPDDLVGRDLDEELVAALGDAVDLPERRLALQVEVLRRAAAEDHAPVLLAREDDRADLVHVEVRIDHERAVVHQLVPGDVHADRAVAGRRGVDRHAELGGARDDRVLLAARAAASSGPGRGGSGTRRSRRARSGRSATRNSRMYASVSSSTVAGNSTS